MTSTDDEHRLTRIVRTPGRDCPAELGLGALLTAYHLRTEEEKGAAVANADRGSLISAR
jgi:putative acetyltransferase